MLYLTVHLTDGTRNNIPVPVDAAEATRIVADYEHGANTDELTIADGHGNPGTFAIGDVRKLTFTR